ncbi:helix-turn-helix domain-containing protein [Aliirhizobium smilacinae]|nr:helix-turn-helix transcriptional regulator [Rhizobium smilacinae]
MFVPLPQSDGRLGIVTYFGQRRDDSAAATMLLEAGAFIAFQRFRVLKNSSGTYILTYRQRLICSFLAIGKSSAEIGSILGITEATVDQHVRNCKERLGTSNRTSTVIEAIRRGQLLSVPLPISGSSREPI